MLAICCLELSFIMVCLTCLVDFTELVDISKKGSVRYILLWVGKPRKERKQECSTNPSQYQDNYRPAELKVVVNPTVPTAGVSAEEVEAEVKTGTVKKCPNRNWTRDIPQQAEEE